MKAKELAAFLLKYPEFDVCTNYVEHDLSEHIEKVIPKNITLHYKGEMFSNNIFFNSNDKTITYTSNELLILNENIILIK